MNDTELDELLNTWQTPPVPTALRERVRAAIPSKHSGRLWTLLPSWKWLAAGTAVAAAVVLLVNTSAFSAKASPPPFTVDSEITLYEGPPSATGCGFCSLYPLYLAPRTMVMTSYNQAGSEVMLSWSAPRQRLVGAFWGARLAVARAIDKVARSVPLAPELESPDYYAVVYTAVGQGQVLGGRDNLVNSGCRLSGRIGKVVGQDVILGYPTVVARSDNTTLWMAPDLSCFALRVRVEREQPDGSWKLVSEKKAVKVTVTPPSR